MSESTVAGGVALGRTAPLPRAAPAPRTRIVTPGRAAWVALAGLIVTATVTVLCSGHTSILSPDSTRPLYPFSSVTGPISDPGPNIGLAGVIAVFTLMLGCYATVLGLGRRLPAKAILATIVVLHVLMALGPPLLSTDVFSYGAYGRMSALYHANPYLLGPNQTLSRTDLWRELIGWQWVVTPTAYGPLFTAMSDLLARLSIGNAVLAYKLVEVAASLLAIAATGKAAQRLGRDPVRATMFVGLNPVLIVYAVGGAHNDLLMLAGLAWAIVALLGHRGRTAGGLIVAATAVKLTAAIMVPFVLVARREPAPPHLRRMLVGAVLVLVGVGIVSAVMFGSGPLHLLSTLEVIQAKGGPQSVPGFIAAGLGFGRLGHGVVIGLQVVTVASILGLLVAVRRQRLDWITATGWAVVVLLLTSTFLLPWYAIWVLPFAALSPSRSLRGAALALTAIGMTSL